MALAALGTLGGAAWLQACVNQVDGVSTESGDAPEVEAAVEALTGTTGIRWVNKMIGTVSDQGLVNVTGAANEVAILTGYNTAGDGGGGIFVWSTATKLHDYGTIINPYVSGNPNPSAAAGWRRVYDGAMNVKWFGATGDNVTPDQTAITRAMNAAAAQGKAVYFPACEPNKYYLCTASLTLPAISYGLTFRGDTVQTTTGVQGRSQIRFTSGGFVVGTNTAAQARWENLIVLVDNVAGAGPAFSLSVTSGQVWDNVAIYNFNSAVSAIQAGNDVAGGGTTLIGATLRNVIVSGVGSKPAIALYSASAAVNNILIDKCLFYASLSSAAPVIVIKALDGGPITNVRIQNTIFEIPIAGAVHFYGVQYSQIVNCWAGDTGSTPLTGPVVKIDRASPTSATSFGILIEGLSAPMGSASMPTVDFNGSLGQGALTMFNSRVPFVTNHSGNPMVAINCAINDSAGAIVHGFDTSANCFSNALTLQGSAFQMATAAPTSGTWKRGDRVFNSTPSAGGVDGWVCVTAGTPGVWKSAGTIAS